MTPARAAEIAALELGTATSGEWENARDDLQAHVAELQTRLAQDDPADIERAATALAHLIDLCGPRVLRRAMRLVVDSQKARGGCDLCGPTFVGKCPHLPPPARP